MPGQGLLQKANLLQREGLAFFDFISKHKIKICAFLTKSNNSFIITQSTGIDADSIFSSIATLDFWNGTIPEINKVYTYSSQDNSINIILQLFSANLKETVTKASIIKLSDEVLFLLCNYEINESILSDIKSVKLEKLKTESTNNSSVVSNSGLIKNYRLEIKNINEDCFSEFNIQGINKDLLINAVYKAIAVKLLISFSDYSTLKIEDLQNYIISMQENSTLPVTLIKTHLISILNDIIPINEDSVSLIEA